MSDFPFTLTDEDLENAFPPRYLERGEGYFRTGRVLTADYTPAQGLVNGRVRGSGGRVYQCVVQLQQDDTGELLVDGECSCPVGYNCKHVVATLLSLPSLRERSVPHLPPAGSSGLPPEVGHWLRRVEQVVADARRDDPNQLLYLLRCEERFGLKRILVRAVKARRLLAGGYGKSRNYTISGQAQASFVTPEDHRIMLLIETGRGQTAQAEAVLDEETSTDVLREIALTGRGYWQSLESPVLRLADPVAGKLLWRLEDDAHLHLRLETERPGLVLLPALPPWYLDPETGECGPLETGLDEHEAGLLAMAPALTPQSEDALNESVPAPLQGFTLPLPSPTERRRVASVPPVPCLYLQSRDLNTVSVVHYWGAKSEPEWSHSAVLTFAYGPFGVVDPRDRKKTLQRVEQGALIESERDLSSESAAIRALEGLGLIRSLGEEDDAGLCFELPDDGAWLHFMGHDIPAPAGAGLADRGERRLPLSGRPPRGRLAVRH